MSLPQRTAELDLLFKSLCSKVLDTKDYQHLENYDLQQLSSFLIQHDPNFSSSRESLNKSLQNWFQGKNNPSTSKLEAIAGSLGYKSYRAFLQDNQQKLRVSNWQQLFRFNPFHKVLIFSGFLLIITWLLPLITGLPPADLTSEHSEDGQLIASAIQAIVVLLFYLMTRFSDFGGRDKVASPGTTNVEARQVLSQFFSGWKYLWLSFTILYGWFWLIYGVGINANPYAQSFSDILTILSSICFAYLFSVMDVESVPRASSEKSLKQFYRYLIVFTIGLCISSMLSILDRYYNLGVIDGMGTYLLGYSNVIVMLYFFGRLESHYLRVNRLVLLPLYSYAIIQIAYVLFFSTAKSGPAYEAYIIGIALILKGFLFFLIRDWIKEGKLEEYFVRQISRSAAISES